MSTESLFLHINKLFDAIERCIEHKLELPTLILIYSGIDIAGWLAALESESTVRENFTKWVDQYINPEANLGCSALDLYSARCAILHTYTPDSRLTDRGKANQIAYAWGDAILSDLRDSIGRSGWNSLVAVHLSDLFRKYKAGMIEFIREASEDPSSAPLFAERSKKVFSNLSKEEIKEYLDDSDRNNMGA